MRPPALACAALLAALAGCPGSDPVEDRPDASSTGYCGDGSLQDGEVCEVQADGTFPAGCELCARCGDGAPGGTETCDDGNDVAGDGCTACRRPGDPYNWYAAAAHAYFVVPLAEHGARTVTAIEGRLELIDTDYRGGADATATPGALQAGLEAPFQLDRVQATADGGTIGCGRGPATTEGTPVQIFSISPDRRPRWTHTVPRISGRRWWCDGLGIDETTGEVVVALLNEKADGNPGGGNVAQLRRLDAAGAQAGDDVVLSSYFDPGVLGVLNARAVSLDVTGDGLVVVSTFAPSTRMLAAIDRDGAIAWSRGQEIGTVLAGAGRVAVVGTDDVVTILDATTGAAEDQWPVGFDAYQASRDRAGDELVVMGNRGDADYASIAGWSYDGAARFGVELAAGLEGYYSSVAIADDDLTFLLHHDATDTGTLTALAP